MPSDVRGVCSKEKGDKKALSLLSIQDTRLTLIDRGISSHVSRRMMKNQDWGRQRYIRNCQVVQAALYTLPGLGK